MIGFAGISMSLGDTGNMTGRSGKNQERLSYPEIVKALRAHVS
jgi:hypothetical protein